MLWGREEDIVAVWYSMGGVLFFQVFCHPPPPAPHFTSYVPDQGTRGGSFSDGRDSSYQSWGGYGYGGGRESRLHAQDIFGDECGVCHGVPTKAPRRLPSREDGNCWQRMGDGVRGSASWPWPSRCRLPEVGNNGIAHAPTFLAFSGPVVDVLEVVASAGLIAVLSTRGYVKQQPTVL